MISITPAGFPIERLGWLLIHSIWQFALLALLIAVLLRLLRSAPATVRYWASLLALGIMVIAPVITFVLLPEINTEANALTPQVARPAPRIQPAVTTASAIAPLPRPDRLPPPLIEPADVNTAIASNPPINTEKPSTSWFARLRTIIAPWLEVCVAIWSIGVFLFALRPLSSWYRLHRLRRVGVSPVPESISRTLARAGRRLGTRKSVRAMQSTLARVPMVVGYIRPVILLPASLATALPASQLEAILLHELAHVRRHDYLVNLAQTLVETLFFYHPAVWWLSARIRQERELCCDELAARALGDRAGYGRALLALEELRGAAPAFSLSAKGGSLLERIRRLTGSEAPRANPGGLVCAVFISVVLVGVGIWSVGYGSENGKAEGKTEKAVASDRPESDDTADQRAKELAVQAHADAAGIDKLPRFFISGRAGTRSFQPMENATDNLAANLKRALDEPIVEEQWWRYETTFAWDEEHFYLGTRAADAYAPDQPQSKNPSGNPASRSVKWGTRTLAGDHHQLGGESSYYVLRENAAAMWKDVFLTIPNYLAITTHRFWWGDNTNRNQNICSRIPPSESTYYYQGTQKFGGETCHVVESPTRLERLWISQETGRIRGFLQFSYHRLNNFYQSDIVQEIAGRSFANRQEYANWRLSDYAGLPADKKARLAKAWIATKDFSKARPSLIVRFRDYRKIAPGIWWPFREDRAQGFPSEDGYQCMRSVYVVDEVRTDLDLTPIVNAVRPEEGQTIQDQRYIVPVTYKYRADRTEEEILELVDEEYQQRLEGQRVFDRLTKPFDEMVGRPAPALPADGWVGGGRPDVDGKPYLIHLWATWCGPCKNDYPILKKLADDGALVVGLHPAGTPAEDVKEMIQEYELGYPTFLSDKKESATGTGRTIAEYPAGVFPYAVIVDADGKVVSHGMLRESDGELLREFRELRRATAESDSQPADEDVPPDNDDPSPKSGEEPSDKDSADANPLNRKVSLSAEQMPLNEALESLCGQAGVKLSLDAEELNEVKLSVDAPITVSFNELVLEEGLQRIVGALSHGRVYFQLYDDTLYFSHFGALRALELERVPEWLRPLQEKYSPAKLDWRGRIVEIDISGENATDEFLENCADLPHLKCLRIYKAEHITARGIEGIGRMSSLVSLEIHGTPFDNRRSPLDYQRSMAAIGRLSGLRELRLIQTGISDGAMIYIGLLKNLRILRLPGNHITDAGVAHLSGMVKLEELCLTNTNIVGSDMLITDAGLAYLAPLHNLRRLEISSLGYTGKGLRVLANFPEIERLAIGGSEVGDAAMLTYVAACTNLESFSMSGTSVTDAGLAALGDMKQLKSISIGNEYVTANGLAVLTELPKLQTIYISDVYINDSLLKHLGEITSLDYLSLRGDGGFVTNEGLACLRTLPNLKTLYFSGIVFESGAFKRLARLDQPPGFPSLKFLNFTGATLEPAAFEGLARFKQLERMHFMLSASKKEMRALQDALPTTHISGTTGGGMGAVFPTPDALQSLRWGGSSSAAAFQ